MKAAIEIRKALDLTQQEMADVLGVSRSHYSMYESGKRELPSAAVQRLAELLSQTKHSKPSTKSELKQQKIKERQVLEKLLHENAYQQMVLAKKIKTLKGKKFSSAGRQSLIVFLNDKSTVQKNDLKMPSILIKAPKAEAIDFSEALVKLEIKMELLAFEKSLLENKIKA